MKKPMIIASLIVLAMGAYPIQCMNALKKKQSDVAVEPIEIVTSYGYAADPNLNRTHPHMEDTYHVEITRDYSFFGLYDGHGGDYVSKYAASHLHENFDSYYKEGQGIEEGLKRAFLKTHQGLDKEKAQKKLRLQ